MLSIKAAGLLGILGKTVRILGHMASASHYQASGGLTFMLLDEGLSLHCCSLAKIAEASTFPSRGSR